MEEKTSGSVMKKKKKMKRKNVVDERFEAIQSDPRFDALPTKKKKVVIDERFKGMLSDTKFGSRNLVDMRGRRVNVGKTNSLKELYDLERSGPSSSEGSSSEDEEKEIKIDLARGDGNLTSSEDDSAEEWDLEECVTLLSTIHYVRSFETVVFERAGKRGQWRLFSSTLSEWQDEVVEHHWGEMDRDARRVEWASRRLALCNMEWERVSATDIYVLLSSFKPPAPAEIRTVTIYLSDFGKQRLEEEDKSGPRLPNITKTIEEGDEIDQKTREALRAYQLDRMRYYYAVIECDSEKTASVIYESCDGAEFESSAIRMDLRFVPDSMTFEESMLKDRATEESINMNTFKPKNFESSALSKSSTKLTWDETDPERIKMLREAFNPDADLDELQNLIAPASSDEEDNGEKDKIRSLFGLAEAPKRNADIEVTWEPKVDLAGEESEVVETDTVKQEKEKGATPWEKYLEKRKAKRKERKAHIAELKRKQKAELEGNVDEPVSSVTKKESTKPREKAAPEVDAEDERFAALYSNSAFAIDQSNPLFKSSKLVEKQATEKQKRRMQEATANDAETLVEKIKRKTEKLNKVKKSVA